MFRVIALAGCLAASVALSVPVASARADGLNVGGTGSANELIKIVGHAWSHTAQGANLELIAGLGSSGAIAAVADGVLDIAISGRTIKTDEQVKGLHAMPFAVTPFVLATSHKIVNSLRSTTLSEFYASPGSTWGDGAPVRSILRPRSESDTALLAGLFPGMADALNGMRQRGDVPLAATDQDNLDLAERVPGSLAAASLAQVLNEKRKLRVLAIDDVTPSVATLESGTYRYVKTFYLVIKSDASPQVRALLTFLKSPVGREALRGAGALPAAD